MVCVHQESLVTIPLRCFFNVASDHVLTSITGASAWPNHDFFLIITVKPILISPLSLLVSFVMRCQPGVVKPIRSTGEAVHLRLDLPQPMQLPVNNLLFTSFITYDKCGNNYVILYIR